jgi:hypothetical protein
MEGVEFVCCCIGRPMAMTPTLALRISYHKFFKSFSVYMGAGDIKFFGQNFSIRSQSIFSYRKN